MIDMNDAYRFGAPCSSPKELITRLQFGAADLWPEDTALPDRWHFMADLIDSPRGILVELDGAVSRPVADALAAAAELCRQSVREPVPAADWRLLRRALEWLNSGDSEVDRALLAVGDELTLIGLDVEEQDFCVATWLCIEVLDRFADADRTIVYWIRRLNVSEASVDRQQSGTSLLRDDESQLSVAV
ncbi:hypothetical protein ACIGGF_18355 [Rhodococcus sp. NPDC078407]|uniref:hypothetical protein n=1 Tax=Rhodococcus sp. NPDC078407 TaxID=3364509 RepID=UPI0037C50E29